MFRNHLKDQRGVAMFFELVLVVAVLSVVGLALYQANQRSRTASLQVQPKAPSTVEGIAATAAVVVEDESATDASLSTSAADASAAELSASGDDITNLEGSFNESNF